MHQLTTTETSSVSPELSVGVMYTVAVPPALPENVNCNVDEHVMVSGQWSVVSGQCVCVAVRD